MDCKETDVKIMREKKRRRKKGKAVVSGPRRPTPADQAPVRWCRCLHRDMLQVQGLQKSRSMPSIWQWELILSYDGPRA